MFLRNLVWFRGLSKKETEDRRESLRFDVPLFIQDSTGKYKEHYGKLGISGFYFETQNPPQLGQLISVKVVLLGLGTEVKTHGRVIKVFPQRNHVGVAVHFEKIPFETERMIARWLDLLTQAHSLAATA